MSAFSSCEEKKKFLSVSSSFGSLSKFNDLFSLMIVFLPKVGIINCSKGRGFHSKRSGSSTLMVSNFVSSVIRSKASSMVKFY